jgi:hypothetical protein
MQLDEFKKSMSLLDQVLSQTSADIRINVSASQNAQTKILKKYRQAFTSCAVLAVVFVLLWIGDVNPQALPTYIKAFLVTYLSLASAWYVFLYLKLKKVNISLLTPARLFSETTTVKLLTLYGEITLGVAAAVFFTLFLQNMLVSNLLAFWLCVVTLIASLVLSICFMWPRYIKLFRDLNTIKE